MVPEALVEVDLGAGDSKVPRAGTREQALQGCPSQEDPSPLCWRESCSEEALLHWGDWKP